MKKEEGQGEEVEEIKEKKKNKGKKEKEVIDVGFELGK